MATSLAVWIAACGSSPPSSSVPAPRDATSVEDDTEPVVPLDVGGTSDADTSDRDTADATVDVGPPPAEAGEACEDDDDCRERLCITLAEDPHVGVCSAPCRRTEDCPEDFACVDDPRTATDGTRWCLPVTLCIDRDGDGYGVGPGCAGPDCDDTDENIYPGAIEQCDGSDNNCNGRIDENPEGVLLDCETGFDGQCAAGRTQCIEGLLDCIALRTPTQEVCNGLDDDCDGVIDEGPDGDVLTRPCYDADPSTVGVGVCVEGTQRCSSGEWAVCAAQIVPTAERCNGLDDDCNGVVDDGAPVRETCDTGRAGQCAEGRTACVDGGLLCEPVREARAEVCNGLDDDCNGQVDEGADGEPLRFACYTGSAATRNVGACRDGYQPCEGGTLLACTDQVLPISEVCNGIDDDCDGLIDEDVPTGQPCATGLEGICSQGFRDCQDGALTCVPARTPIAEVCNAVDDNCDGTVDLGPDGEPLARACWPGRLDDRNRGVCRDGVETCQDGSFTTCTDPILPSPEVCNGLDDNCNGAIDEGTGGGPCSTGLPGLCAQGALACEGASVCQQVVFPADEVCNGLDDNCNGMVDEGVADIPCWPEGIPGRDTGVCRDGTRACVGGVFGACAGAVLPSTEICDNLDNDCDGSVDEGNPGGNQSCETALPGICRPGRTLCDGGSIACVANESPRAEACNGLDDNCDGLVDNAPGGGPVTQSCYNGTPGTDGVGECRRGLRTCSGGTLGECEGQVLPTPESCNGRDNDCDGVIDDGCPISIGWGAPTTSQVFGGTGGTLRDATLCPAGQVLTGINVRSGGRIDYIQGVCSTLSLNPVTTTTPWTYLTTTGSPTSTLTGWGGTGGTYATYRCPTQHVIHRFDVRHGSEVDNIRPYCGRVSFTGLPGSFTATITGSTAGTAYGGSGGTPSSFTCPSNGVITGFQVRSAARVDRIEFTCRVPLATLR